MNVYKMAVVPLISGAYLASRGVVALLASACAVPPGTAPADPPGVVSQEPRKSAESILRRNPFDSASLWRAMRARITGRAGGMLIESIAGVDIALWDVAGKVAGLPIHRLLGGSGRSRTSTTVRTPASHKCLTRSSGVLPP